VSELQVAGKTVLLTSHDDQFLTQMCDEMFAVHEGRVSKMEAANAVD
jgi:ABC-type siderophore export system fused ATPase/permease subunit